ncbi:MAG TPA: thermonuclease family protein, partial [Terriglobales bacterium]|nr:thermonuclease family protein [Terriglobales bacterium]
RILLFAMLATLLASCAPGGLSGAEQTAAVSTAVADLLAAQAATSAAQVVPTQEQATTAPLVMQAQGEENFNYPPEAACIPVGTDHAVGTVTDIWKGDEIQVEVNGESFDVRYIGVDSGELSPDVNSQLVLGKQVLLIRDVTDVDEYGRLLRYVINSDGVFVNYELLKRGAAFLSIEEPDKACEQAFDQVAP